MDLTPVTKNRFLRPIIAVTILALNAPFLSGQNNNVGAYQGPGVSTPGAPEVGTRSGQQVDLRFFAGVSGVYDNSLRPLVTDAQGNLTRIQNLYGVEVSGGAYGTHNFKRSQLALDYAGAYRRYTQNTYYNGSDQTLSLNYTYQSSRRVIFKLAESVGTLAYGNSSIGASAANDLSGALSRSAVFYDSRVTYLRSTASLTWLQSSKTSFTASGSGFLYDRKQAVGLTSTWGYDLTGGINRNLSRTNSIGASYTYSHFEFPGFGSISDTNAYHGTFSSGKGRAWTFYLQAGIAVSETRSPFSFTLSPILAELYGRDTVSVVSHSKNTVPSGAASLKRQFQRSVLTFNYSRGVISGNGFSTTARNETAAAGYSYTGLRRMSLTVDGGYYSLSGFGQSFGKTSQASVGGGASYNLMRATHLTFRYDFRDQQISNTIYALRGSRVAVGLMFSPGNIPLSIW